MQLDGRVALVTGGGSGLGEAASRLLVAEGSRVAVLGRSDEELRHVLSDLGAAAMPVVADISKSDEMERACRQVVDRWGRLDIVFANAGVNGVWASLEDLTPEEWRRTLDINLTGTFFTVKYAVPYMKERGGSVIITSSVNGTRMFSNTGATAYSCSKAGQVAFTKMVALELAPKKIRVNVICPGAIHTNIEQNTERRNLEEIKAPVEFPEGIVPLNEGRPGTAEQVARLVLFLASDAADHISGTEIWIDGAESLLQG